MFFFNIPFWWEREGCEFFFARIKINWYLCIFLRPLERGGELFMQ